jgi:hypothetical protein
MGGNSETGHQNGHSIAQYDGVKVVSSSPRLDMDAFRRANALAVSVSRVRPEKREAAFR